MFTLHKAVSFEYLEHPLHISVAIVCCKMNHLVHLVYHSVMLGHPDNIRGVHIHMSLHDLLDLISPSIISAIQLLQVTHHGSCELIRVNMLP